MLTLQQIVMATPAKIKARARQQCFARLFAPPRKKSAQQSLTKSGGYLVEDESGRYREFAMRTKCTDGWRKVAIRFYGPLNPSTPVWCWCDCPYFKYHCEVALSRRGSSAVIQSNGQRPRHTNPKMEPRVCKHVFLAFMLALRRRPPGRNDKMGALNQITAQVQKRLKEGVAWAGDRLRGAGRQVR